MELKLEKCDQTKTDIPKVWRTCWDKTKKGYGSIFGFHQSNTQPW